MVGDYIGFYILFESCLIPTFILVIGWGYQPERIQAGIYIILYTVVGSLPLLAVFIILKTWCGRARIVLRRGIGWGRMIGRFVFLARIVAFLVKLPMFVFHL